MAAEAKLIDAAADREPHGEPYGGLATAERFGIDEQALRKAALA